MGLSLVLDDLVLIQNANPDPPVARIERLHARVHWTPLIKASLVGDVLIDRPRLYIHLNHVKNAFFKAILPGFEREVSDGQQKQ